jgi:hypothetical protein
VPKECSQNWARLQALSAIAGEVRTRAKVQQMNIRPGQSEASVETIMICVKKEKKKKRKRKRKTKRKERKDLHIANEARV